MAKLTIGDITASEQIDITDDSLLAGQKLNDMQSARAFLAALGKPVTDKTFNDVALVATFENSTIPFEKNTVDFKAGVNALISVARASDTPLFGKDDYDAVDIVGNDCWVGVEFDTLLDAKVSVPLPQGFGVSFGANTTAAFATYQLVPDAVALNEKLGDALSAALSAYNVMATAEQVMKIPAGLIYTSDVTGSFKVGGSWTLPTSINQMSLADAKLPFNASLSVAPAVTVSVAGSVAVSGAFGVRFRRSGANAIRLGIYKKSGHHAYFEQLRSNAHDLCERPKTVADRVSLRLLNHWLDPVAKMPCLLGCGLGRWGLQVYLEGMCSRLLRVSC